MPLKILTAPSFLELENELFRQVIRERDRLEKHLIVVPSSALKKYLVFSMAESLKETSAIINVRIITVLSFAREIAGDAADLKNRKLIQDPYFFHLIIKKIIEEQECGKESFSDRLKHTEGAAGSLYPTFRDLEDAGVESNFVETAIEELMSEKDEEAGNKSQKPRKNRNPPLQNIQIIEMLDLFKKYLEKIDSLGISRFSDIIKKASECFADSDFAKEYRKIFYHGFYDLTGLQKDLLVSVSKSSDTTMLLPFKKLSEFYRFSENFLDDLRSSGIYTDLEDVSDSSVQTAGRGILEAESPVQEKSDVKTGSFDGIYFMSGAGADEEVCLAAKEILMKPVKPYETAVVSRTINHTLPHVETVFGENSIPWSSPRQKPANDYPVVRFVRSLISFMEKGYQRSQIEILLRLKIFCPDLEYRQYYKPAFLKAGIIDGKDWERLGCYAEAGMEIEVRPWGGDSPARDPETENAAENEDEFSQKKMFVKPDGVREMISVISSLIDLHRQGSRLRSFREMGQWFLKVIEFAAGGKIDIFPSKDRELIDEVAGFCRESGNYDITGVQPELSLFLSMLDSFAGSMSSETGGQGSGVFVSDVMAARGMNFDHVFILGLNEKIFPRIIREDPFLEDDARRKLRMILKNEMGFRLPIKEEGFSEEKLLFILTVLSARKSVYLSSMRTDTADRISVDSIFKRRVKEIVIKAGSEQAKEKFIMLPGHVHEKFKSIFRRKGSLHLNPSELLTCLSLDYGTSITDFENKFFFVKDVINTDSFFDGLKMVNILSKGKGFLEYDGNISTDITVTSWHAVPLKTTDYMYITHLNSLSRCPFQHFCRKILSLQSAFNIPEIWEMTQQDEGIIAHEILRRLYLEEFCDKKYSQIDKKRVMARLDYIIDDEFKKFLKKNPSNVPFLSDFEQEKIRDYLKNMVVQDIGQRISGGWIVRYVEDMEFPAEIGQPFVTLETGERIRFRVDRIDQHPDRGLVNYIDYKIAKSRSSKELSKRILEGLDLQLPAYILGALEKGLGAEKISATFVYPEAEDCFCGSISGEFIKGKEDKIRTILQTLRDLGKHGYFVFSGAFGCGYCEMRWLCRKNSRAANKRLSSLLNNPEEIEKFPEISRYFEFAEQR